MRCKNCGYVNEDGVQKCIKCNANLQGSMASESNGDGRANNPIQHSGSATVRETPAGRQGVSPAPRRRPEPGSHPSPQGRVGGTINRWGSNVRGDVAYLEALDNVKPHPAERVSIELFEDENSLVRSNTNPADKTISSSHQAKISREADGWYIEDQSDYNTTCLIVRGKTKLEEGDIIVLGSSRFIFRFEDPRLFT